MLGGLALRRPINVWHQSTASAFSLLASDVMLHSMCAEAHEVHHTFFWPTGVGSAHARPTSQLSSLSSVTETVTQSCKFGARVFCSSALGRKQWVFVRCWHYLSNKRKSDIRRIQKWSHMLEGKNPPCIYVSHHMKFVLLFEGTWMPYSC